jgi:hypothetical protein
MNLLSEAMETCNMLDKTTEGDGYGGYTAFYKKGAEFKAAITFDSSIEARRADKEGVTSLYTVTTPRSFTLEYHDVFVRARDGKIFRVTSDGDDKYTPASATLDMRQVSAEEWSIEYEQSPSNT